MLRLPEPLQPLAAYKQFILWTIIKKTNDAGEVIEVKVPVDYRTAEVGDAHDPALWLDSSTACTLAAQYGSDYGVGFVFTANDPFFFVDLDKCLEPDGVSWSPVAMAVIGMLPGAAVEISQSGRGLHIFGQGRSPDHSCKNVPLRLEFYTESRFVALTGNGAIGSAALDFTAHLPALVDGYFPPKGAAKGQEWTNEPVADWNGPTDDDELIKKAKGSQSAGGVFGNRSTFAALWDGDEDTLTAAYPDDEGRRAYDGSSADAALAQHLAFWTGNNCERILGLMWKSGLVRDKWNRDDYLVRTITRAASLQESFYSGPPERVPVKPMTRIGVEGPKRREGWQFLSLDGQLELFSGCVYIQNCHKVFTPDGVMLKPEQFNATYGGYVFQLEDNASGKTTTKAWEAFTMSQGIEYPFAHKANFRPELPAGTLVSEEGWISANTYVPIETPRQQGDAALFLNHLTKLLPIPEDREILLAYMAACVQHKGVKFQWAPLIQGAEGNGKTLFTRCVAFALGERYTHLPPATDIAEKFNEWLFGKLFIGIEDVYVPDHKKEIIEVVKPMITNDRLAMRAMQASQVMGDNRANFILNSNHKDAWRKTKSDRRIAVFYTAQQDEADIARDGLSGDYFPNLYRWLKNQSGYEIVSNYLASYTIPEELNPATKCHRAPRTSSHDEAVTASLGGVEQEILEAIDEGRPGFAGGWVSSMALDKLLQDRRSSRSIPPNKRRDVLKSLGYDWHPALNQGRVNNLVAFDGGKPRLFIRDGHIARNITSAAEVARVYSEAQGAPNVFGGQNVSENTV